MIHVTVTLSDWMYRSVVSKSVLTLHRDYFRLRKPLERRVYEIARKHCGRQAEWRIGLETLVKKSGSTSPRRVFRKMIRDIAAEDLLPDYTLSLGEGDVVLVRARAGSAARGRGGAAPRSRDRTPASGWRRPATTPTGSRPNGGAGGSRAANRGSTAPMPRSSPSPGRGRSGRRWGDRDARSAQRQLCARAIPNKPLRYIRLICNNFVLSAETCVLTWCLKNVPRAEQRRESRLGPPDSMGVESGGGAFRTIRATWPKDSLRALECRAATGLQT